MRPALSATLSESVSAPTLSSAMTSPAKAAMLRGRKPERPLVKIGRRARRIRRSNSSSWPLSRWLFISMRSAFVA